MGKEENFSNNGYEGEFKDFSFSDSSESNEASEGVEDDLVHKLSFDFHRDDHKIYTDKNSEEISTALQNWTKEQKIALQNFLKTLDIDQLYKVQYGIYQNYTDNNRVELINICKDLVHQPELLKSAFDTARSWGLTRTLIAEYKRMSVLSDNLKKENKLSKEYSENLLITLHSNLEKYLKLSGKEAISSSEERNFNTTGLEENRTAAKIFLHSLELIAEEGLEKGKEFNFKELNKLNFERKYSTEIDVDSEEAKQMREIYIQNYKDAKYPESFIKKLIESFNKLLEGGFDTKFCILKREGKVVGFNRFDQYYTKRLGQGSHAYFGSFNLKSDYMGLKLGEALMEESFLYEGWPTVFADCDPRSPITKKYIEYGFVAYESYSHDEMQSLKIYRSEDLNKEVVSKNMTIEECNDRKELNNQDNSMLFIDAQSDGSPDLLPLNQGYLLTRHIKNDHKGYYVYERAARPNVPEDTMMFKPPPKYGTKDYSYTTDENDYY